MSMRRDCGYSIIELLAVLAAIGIVSAVAVPQVLTGLDNLKLGAAVRGLHGELQNARLKAVSANRAMRFRFDCPAAGQYRRVELIGTPAAPDAKDIEAAAVRCDSSTYPYPAPDQNLLTRPNNDGAIQALAPGMSFTASKTIEFWPDGTAHVDTGTGTPWPRIGTTNVTLTISYRSTTKSITVNGVGKIQIQ